MDPKRRPRARIAAAGGVLALAAAGCGGGAERPPVATGFANHDPSVAYLGAEACRSCHFEKHETYEDTGMGRAFYPMDGAVPVEDWTDRNQIDVEPAGLRYRMEHRADGFYQAQFLVDSHGQELSVDEHKLVWVIGSNNHSRSYVVERDGKLFQAPVCWYEPDKLWDLCPGYEFKNDHFGREISLGCIHCHNGRMEVVEGERNRFREPYPHGIGCERCHGPGEAHVARWSAPGATPTGGADSTIVNPVRLPRPDRIHVCFQCHLGDARATERIVRPGREMNDYRPGQRITDYVVPFTYKQKTQWDFGLSAQADRLMLSRCFVESGGQLDCLSCHNPHITVYHEKRPPNYFRQRCLGCHAAEACGAPAAERQATPRVADDCVACHMRRAEPDDSRHAWFTDHWIRRRIDLPERDYRQDFDVEPVFPDHFATLAPGEQAFFRARGRQLLAQDAPASRYREMWLAAEHDFQEAIDLGYDTVDAWFFLGKMRTYLGRHEEAAAAYETAVKRDPTHHDAAYAWGQALLQRGDAQQALDVFAKMLERDPGDAMALAETGRALTDLGRVDEALEHYERAIREEPWQADFHRYRGMLLAASGRFPEAAEAGAAAARLNPDDPASWEFYAKVMQAAGRPDDAREGQRILALLR